MGTKNDLQKEKEYSTEEKNTYKKYRSRSVGCFYIEILDFLFQNGINSFYILYYNY